MSDDINLFDWLAVRAKQVIVVFAILSLVAMAGLFSLAFFRIGHGLVEMFRNSGESSGEVLGLESTIRGIELLFLAPLAYFVLRSLAKYCQEKGGSAARAELVAAKALVVGLLIAILSSDLVGKILSREPVNTVAAVIEIATIVVLSAYYFLIERLVHEGPGQRVASAAPVPKHHIGAAS